MSVPVGRVALVFRGDRRGPGALAANPRLQPVANALAGVGLAVETAVYSDDAVNDVRDQLLAVDGALVWVDPVSGGEDRAQVDSMLREVAASGVWVSAHPDVILKMGTKEVLYRTRDLGWGSETYLYRTVEELAQQFPDRLASGEARVLKQYRGNGGIGVQKVELVGGTPSNGDVVVRVQNARTRDDVTEEMPLGELVRRCARYFDYSEGAGRLVDQPFQPRITEGIIRCYLVKSEVVGFARQHPSRPSRTVDPAAVDRTFGLPSEKSIFARDEPAFRVLRSRLETEWVPALQAIVDVDDASLPALWDADFLFGPKTDDGADTYILCEINVSSVLPFPPAAPALLARATLAAIGSSG
jgi:hypothetical protein